VIGSDHLLQRSLISIPIPFVMGSSRSTLGLDFSKGRVFADEIYNASGLLVHPMENMGSFTLAVSFSRHNFRLTEDSVAIALESALGCSAIEFVVSSISDKVLSFNVSCKEVGFHIVDLRSFSCLQFKCYFHLWGNGGPNWGREFKIWKKECDAERILVNPSKRRASLGLLAMHNPPAKSSFKSTLSVRKKLSFATFKIMMCAKVIGILLRLNALRLLKMLVILFRCMSVLLSVLLPWLIYSGRWLRRRSSLVR
jgi:hypothetical protein